MAVADQGGPGNRGTRSIRTLGSAELRRMSQLGSYSPHANVERRSPAANRMAEAAQRELGRRASATTVPHAATADSARTSGS